MILNLYFIFRAFTSLLRSTDTLNSTMPQTCSKGTVLSSVHWVFVSPLPLYSLQTLMFVSPLPLYSLQILIFVSPLPLYSLQILSQAARYPYSTLVADWTTHLRLRNCTGPLATRSSAQVLSADHQSNGMVPGCRFSYSPDIERHHNLHQHHLQMIYLVIQYCITWPIDWQPFTWVVLTLNTAEFFVFNFIFLER